jgi:hypothetical protein
MPKYSSFSLLITMMFLSVLSFKAPIKVIKTGLGVAGSRLFATKNFYTVSEDELKATIKEWGQPSFRVGQVRSWIYEKGVDEFDQMLDLPKALRTKLAESFSLGDLRIASEQVSKDGTKKRAYALHDGQLIEVGIRVMVVAIRVKVTVRVEGSAIDNNPITVNMSLLM